jgi:ethanolamine ammonia-lyase small subunit
MAARSPSDSTLATLLAATPARLAIGRSGPRPRTATYLDLIAAHGRARDAVHTEVAPALVRRLGLRELATEARTRDAYVREPRLGRTLAASAKATLRRCRRAPEVQIVVADGLSSAGIVTNAGPVLTALTKLLRARGRRLGTPLFARNARVRIQDEIGEVLRPEVCVLLIGERPGLAIADSLSAYVIHRPRRTSAEPDRTVLSNVHRRGVPPARAARLIADLVDDMLARGASGAALARLESRPGVG